MQVEKMDVSGYWLVVKVVTAARSISLSIHIQKYHFTLPHFHSKNNDSYKLYYIILYKLLAPFFYHWVQLLT